MASRDQLREYARFILDLTEDFWSSLTSKQRKQLQTLRTRVDKLGEYDSDETKSVLINDMNQFGISVLKKVLPTEVQNKLSAVKSDSEYAVIEEIMQEIRKAIYSGRTPAPNPARRIIPANVQMKVVLIGNSQVGKTVLGERYLGKDFEENQEPTIGARNIRKSEPLNGTQVKLQIWDPAGSERYRSLLPMYHEGAALIIVVYDVTNRESFDYANKFLTSAKYPPNASVVVVANKTDKPQAEWKVTPEEGLALANKFNALYQEASAKSNTNVARIFQEGAKAVLASGHLFDHVRSGDTLRTRLQTAVSDKRWNQLARFTSKNPAGLIEIGKLLNKVPDTTSPEELLRKIKNIAQQHDSEQVKKFGLFSYDRHPKLRRIYKELEEAQDLPAALNILERSLKELNMIQSHTQKPKR